jgi:general secretion pathway protein C
MPTPSKKNLWMLRFVTFLLAAAAAGSAAYWFLQWNGAGGTSAVVAVDAQAPVSADPAAVARALGAVAPGAAASAPTANPASSAASRFALTGVLAWRSQNGAALIAVDGKPPKSFAVGARVGDEWTLKSVQARSAVLVSAPAGGTQAGAGAEELVLDLPLPSKGKNTP